MALAKKYQEYLKRYSYEIHFSDEDQVFVASVKELPGCMSHGETEIEALGHIHEAAELYVESCVDRKLDIPEPISMIKASGQFLVRGTPELHKKLIQRQHEEGFTKFSKFMLATLESVAMGSIKPLASGKRIPKGAKPVPMRPAPKAGKRRTG